jgi:hypothetical protein
MDNDTTEPFCLPATGRRKVTAALDGGRLTSDGGVMLLAAAGRHLGLCDRLATLIADPRDPSRVTLVHNSRPAASAHGRRLRRGRGRE